MYNFLITILKESNLLNKLPESTISRAFEDGTMLLNKFKKNEIVHLEGENCNSIEVVIEGTLVIDNIDSMGDILRITEFEKGDLLAGNIVFLENAIYPMTITTTTEATLVEIEKEKLLMLLQENTLFLNEFLKLMALNANVLSKKAKDQKYNSLREKILTYLNYEEKKQNSNVINLPHSKKFLAEKFGVQRTSLSRELKKMEKDQLIILNKKNIRIL